MREKDETAGRAFHDARKRLPGRVSQAELARRVARLLGKDHVRVESISRWERTGIVGAAYRDALDAALRGEGAPPVAPALAIASPEPQSKPSAAPDAARRADALARLRAVVEEVAALCGDDSEGEGSGRLDGGRP